MAGASQPPLRGLRVGCIGYLNSRAFYRNLQQGGVELVEGSPSELFGMFSSGRIDAGLLPVGGLAELPPGTALTMPLGISARRRAMSVNLYSDAPPRELHGAAIGVTSQTMSSARLLRILAQQLWRLSGVRYVELQQADAARLLIGDAALRESRAGRHACVTDLGEEWVRLTGRPFLFAQWAVRAEAGAERAAALEALLLETLERNLAEADLMARESDYPFMTTAEIGAYIANFTYKLEEDDIEGAGEFKRRLAELGAAGAASRQAHSTE